jgi:hypothetical protein
MPNYELGLDGVVANNVKAGWVEFKNDEFRDDAFGKQAS